VAQESAEHPEPRVLGLREAERLALEGNRSLEVARARADAEVARVAAVSAFRWPALAGEVGFTRSDDPVAAFGTRLRQGRFTEADLALDALNDPNAVEDWQGALDLRWAALDAARWEDMAAAEHSARAAELSSGRAAEAVVFRTRVLYLEAVGAEARLRAARAAEAAARSTAEVVGRRFTEGLGTEADVLQAEANLAGAMAVATSAVREVADAQGRLTLHLGLPAGVAVATADTTLAPVPEGPLVTPVQDSGLRSDLRASLERTEAAAAGARKASASRLPVLAAFARISSHAPEAFGDRGNDLTMGVQVSVPLFTGGALGAAADEARALERVARAEHQDRVETARIELEESLRAVEAARQGARASDAARAAADEAYRLVSRRFQEGMATTAELLQAEARATEFRTRSVDGRVRYHQAMAALAFARGDRVDLPAEVNP
jgi:outer membrane protein TolC